MLPPAKKLKICLSTNNSNSAFRFIWICVKTQEAEIRDKESYFLSAKNHLKHEPFNNSEY